MSNCKNPCFDDLDSESHCNECEPLCPIRVPKITLLEAISLLPQTVLAGLAVPFDTNLISLGYGIIHTPGGTDFNLIAPGIYRVTFTGSVTPVGTTAGVAIAVNGSIISGTTVTETVVAGTVAALSTQAIVQVSPYISTIVRVVNPTAGTEVFTNPNIIIEKIG